MSRTSLISFAITLVVTLGVFTSFTSAQGSKYPPLAVGEDAPDFSLPFTSKDSMESFDLRLSSYIGLKNVILTFYPAAWSGGCTREACTIRDNFSALSEFNAEIIAISGDYPYTLFEWAKHHNLPFLLASDHKHSVAATYGSYNENSGYNKRTVYIIDRKGKIAYIDLMYSTRDLASFEKLRDAMKNLE